MQRRNGVSYPLACSLLVFRVDLDTAALSRGANHPQNAGCAEFAKHVWRIIPHGTDACLCDAPLQVNVLQFFGGNNVAKLVHRGSRSCGSVLGEILSAWVLRIWRSAACCEWTIYVGQRLDSSGVPRALGPHRIDNHSR